MGTFVQLIGAVCIIIAQFVPFPDEQIGRFGTGDYRRVKLWVFGLFLLLIGFTI